MNITEKTMPTSLSQIHKKKEQAEKILIPEPIAIGNEDIAIVNHSLSHIDMGHAGVGGKPFYCIDFAMKNISNTTIATVTFEAIFYDIGGNAVDKIKYNELYFKSNTSRASRITSLQDPDQVKIKSYKLIVRRSVAADVERAQIRWHAIKTTDQGESVNGIVKNISDKKTDVALVANFTDSRGERIGSKVVIIRDIEAGDIKQFEFIFKPQPGDTVKTYSLNVVSDIEG